MKQLTNKHLLIMFQSMVAIKYTVMSMEIIKLLSKDIKTDQKIAIDYHEVNLSKTGIYKVYYRFGDSFREIKVEVYA